MDDRYTLAIKDYAMDRFKPERIWPRTRFEFACYSEWAVNEILDLIQDRGAYHPIDVIEEFIEKMDRYSRMNPKSHVTFSIARDIGEDILDMFRAME